LNQNGIQSGTVTGISISSEGLISGLFSSGRDVPLYLLDDPFLGLDPVADVDDEVLLAAGRRTGTGLSAVVGLVGAASNCQRCDQDSHNPHSAEEVRDAHHSGASLSISFPDLTR
jgi:hypothetical protein